MPEINVQTTVPETMYEALWRMARTAKRPLKAVVRDAIESYLRQSSPAEKDPLMQFVGGGRLKADDGSSRHP